MGIPYTGAAGGAYTGAGGAYTTGAGIPYTGVGIGHWQPGAGVGEQRHLGAGVPYTGVGVPYSGESGGQSGAPYSGAGSSYSGGQGFMRRRMKNGLRPKNRFFLLLWHGKQMLADAHSDPGWWLWLWSSVVLPAMATKVPSGSDSGTILDGSCPGQGSLLDALWSCAKHSAARRSMSAGSGTANAPELSSLPMALLSYSPLPFLHLILTPRPLNVASASMLFLAQCTH